MLREQKHLTLVYADLANPEWPLQSLKFFIQEFCHKEIAKQLYRIFRAELPRLDSVYDVKIAITLRKRFQVIT